MKSALHKPRIAESYGPRTARDVINKFQPGKVTFRTPGGDLVTYAGCSEDGEQIYFAQRAQEGTAKMHAHDTDEVTIHNSIITLGGHRSAAIIGRGVEEILGGAA